MDDDAEPPLRLAVIVATPSLFATTGNSAKSAPAATFTCGGTDAMAGSPEASATAVATFGARDSVTRSTPGVPFGSVALAGAIVATTGGGGVTSTVLTAL